jgi:N-acetyl sugar amidotransferase
MKIIEYPKAVELNSYAPNSTSTSTFYGLPAEVKFCKKCVISNQRPNSAIEHKHKASSEKSTISFDSKGVCDACNQAFKKHNEIDWAKRESDLKILCDRYRSRTGEYDCLVPGSGGKDSFYAAHVLKYKYGMHPLTVTWAPHIYTDWGWQNQQAWIHSGFDNFLHTPNGLVHRLLTRLAVENLFHPFQPFIIGQKYLAPKLAALFKIPLVFYGENEAEYGNPSSDNNIPTRDISYYSSKEADEEIFLSGVSVADLKSAFGLTTQDLIPYLPISQNNLFENQISVHYLGYYLKWHPQSCYYYAVEHGGFKASPERTPGTYSKYNSIDDKIDDLHYYTTAIKFGIGRATYDASQEIRSQDITREEGVSLVKKYDCEYPSRFEEELFNYLSIPKDKFPIASELFEKPIMNKEYFSKLSDKFRSPHLWKFENGVWMLRHTVWREAE